MSEEEAEMQLTKVVPFLVEDESLRLGAIFDEKADWQPFFIVDGRLITGQNPASSRPRLKRLCSFGGESRSRFCLRWRSLRFVVVINDGAAQTISPDLPRNQYHLWSGGQQKPVVIH